MSTTPPSPTSPRHCNLALGSGFPRQLLLLRPSASRFCSCCLSSHTFGQSGLVESRCSITAPIMEPSFPHILNPQISGTSFGSMLDSRDPLPPEQDPNASVTTDLYRDTAANGSRKRPASRIKSTYPRKRAIQACQKCRARRTKCNNARPTCSSCLDLGVDCSYAESDPSR